MYRRLGLIGYLFCYFSYAFTVGQSLPINDDLMKLANSTSSAINGKNSEVSPKIKFEAAQQIGSEQITNVSFKNKPTDEHKRLQKYKRKHKPAIPSVKRDNHLDQMIMDFNYAGDVSGVISVFKEYSPDLVTMRSLGKKKSININISLQGVKLQDITDAIANQTNNTVHLVYTESNNSIRLHYTGVIDVGQSAVEESLKWQKGDNPKPVLKQDGVVRFPFGEYQPVVTCQPLNLCDIELQAGEDVQGIVIGDSLRWNEGDQGIPIVYSGSSSKLVPHLVLKPSQSGLDTTLMVTTSKRTYMLKLKSAMNGHVARVGFYYPSELIQTFTDNKNKLGNKAQAEIAVSDSIGVLDMPLINLSRVNYAYLIKGDDYHWKPTQVFDDGVSVYIQMPDGVSARSLPGLCILVDGDRSESKCEMVNFRYNEHFYIVDKLFNKAKLINGYDNYMQSITISRKPDKPGLWSRIFGG
jgi:type IV secretion system protein TrbG